MIIWEVKNGLLVTGYMLVYPASGCILFVCKGKAFVNLLRAAEFKVGLFVLSVALLIAYMSLKVSEGSLFSRGGYSAWFRLNNAGGLVKNSAVRVAGIPMGTIRDIKLQDGKARVEIAMNPEVEIYKSASILIKSSGILGDSHVELVPGSPTDALLPPGGQIMSIEDKGNLDNLIYRMGNLIGNLTEASQVMKEAFTGEGPDDHILSNIIQNTNEITSNLAEITSNEKAKISEITENLYNITSSLNEALNSKTSGGGFNVVWKKVLTRLDVITKDLENVARKVNEGEGTVGKLISDEDTAEKVSRAIDGLKNLVDSASKIETSIDANTTYMSGILSGTKTMIGLRVQPGLDRYYLLGVVSDPMGVVSTNTYVSSGTTTENYTQTATNYQGYKFNIEFAKVFYTFTLRAGIIENYGGIGADYEVLSNKKLIFSFDMNNLSHLNLQPRVQINLWKGIYLVSGVYDALNRSERRSPYLGMGVFLTNDDLKMLLGRFSL